MTFQTEKLTRDELLSTLKLLKEYRSAQRQIGNRASISSIAFPKCHIRVEYAPNAPLPDIQKMIASLFKGYFQEVPYIASEVEFKESGHLSGGIRLFIGDDMIDISFDRFIPLLKQY